MFCANCGEKLDEGVKFCGKCGTRVAENTASTPVAVGTEQGASQLESMRSTNGIPRQASHKRPYRIFGIILCSLSAVFLVLAILYPPAPFLLITYILVIIGIMAQNTTSNIWMILKRKRNNKRCK